MRVSDEIRCGVAATAVTLLAALAGCGGHEPPRAGASRPLTSASPTASTALGGVPNLGTPITFGDVESGLTVTIHEYLDPVASTVPGWTPQRRGTRLVAFRFTMENIGTSTRRVYVWANLRATDTNGVDVTLDDAPDSTTAGDTVRAVNLHPGETGRGWLAYTLDSSTMLEYVRLQSDAGTTLAEWRVTP